jgi:hypothetical protein
MPIERFVWTSHARDRCAKRLLDLLAIEHAIHTGHSDRHINRGRAEWRIEALLADGRRVVVIYDHPVGANLNAARIVSAWEI